MKDVPKAIETVRGRGVRSAWAARTIGGGSVGGAIDAIASPDATWRDGNDRSGVCGVSA